MIFVTICTRQRPNSLRKALKSFTKVTADARVKLKFMIIESGEPAGVKRIVAEFQGILDINYINEPRIGIVYARNAGVETFLRSDATWMATIDDDETVSDGWLVAMLDAIESYPFCKVFSGPQIHSFPEEASIWLANGVKRSNPDTGTPHWNVSTANALFRREVFSENGLNLRFHPLFNLSGGSDVELFFRLKDLGEDVLWVKDAECYEIVPLSRANFKVRAKRAVQQAQNWGRICMLRFGWPKAVAWLLYYFVIQFINFVVYAMVGLGVVVLNKNKGVRILNRGMFFGLTAAGYFKAIFFQQGELYRNVDGG